MFLNHNKEFSEDMIVGQTSNFLRSDGVKELLQLNHWKRRCGKLGGGRQRRDTWSEELRAGAVLRSQMSDHWRGWPRWIGGRDLWSKGGGMEFKEFHGWCPWMSKTHLIKKEVFIEDIHKNSSKTKKLGKCLRKMVLGYEPPSLWFLGGLMGSQF